MITYSCFEHFKYVEPISKDYRVFVNGNEIPVYTCRISKVPFNRAWPGHQREINQTELASFINIVSDEELNVEVIVNGEYEKIILKPYSKGIAYEDEDGSVKFKLKENGQFVLGKDNLHNCLYIFNNKPVVCLEPASVTHYFGPGVHMPGKLQLKDNESVYIDKDALVFGCIYAEDAENIRIFGNGILDDSAEERYSVHCYEKFTNGNMKFYDCKNIKVEGVLLRNSAIWCVNLFHCLDVELDNIKIFGQWRYNTDGVDIVNSRNILLKNSFIHSFDDSVTIKGIDRYIDTNNENIVTENCVLWCDWGKACEIGFETACRKYKNIIFKNCDILRSAGYALDIANGDCAEVSDVVFENINVEYNSFDDMMVIQNDDEHQYSYDGIWKRILISVKNDRFRNDSYCDGVWGIPKELAEVDLSGIKQATVHDVIVKNITVYYDEEIQSEDDKYSLLIEIDSCLENVEHYNITLENIVVNGKKVNEENATIKISGVNNFEFID